MNIVKKFILVFVVFSWLGGTPANASFYDGNRLYEWLKSARTGQQRDGAILMSASRASGYIAGVADAMSGKKDPNTGFMFCMPTGVTIGQLDDVVLGHLEKNPQTRHSSAWSLVENAFQEAFPCK